MRVIAINALRRKANGQTQKVKPGALLELKGKELVELLDAEAVVKPEDPRAAKFGYGPKKGFKAEAQDVGVAQAQSFEDIIDTKGSGAPEAEAEAETEAETPNADDMTVKEVESFMDENLIEPPDGWSKKSADEKRDFLKNYLAAEEAGV